MHLKKNLKDLKKLMPNSSGFVVDGDPADVAEGILDFAEFALVVLTVFDEEAEVEQHVIDCVFADLHHTPSASFQL
ncbi:hypothetical protein HDU92_006133 [Lobulomyces angularis]|nr:hypothetical protein HDU92_006133 [Lobulomyces angularis]